MLSLNTANPLQGLHIGTVLPGAQSSGSQGSQSLKDVIEKLAQSVTKDGKLDTESPLGKMVAKEMPFAGTPLAGLLGGKGEDIKGAVEKLLKDKLGDNFGAAAGQGLGGGGDLLSQALNGLGKASLDDLLGKQGDGTKFSSDDMPQLEKIADFMDQNPTQFPAPDSGSWKNELKEDNFLDGAETDSFRAALDMLGSQMGQQQVGAQSPGGGLGTPQDLTSGTAQGTPAAGGQSGDVTQDLGQLLGGLLQKGLEASQGAGTGSTGQSAAANDPAQPASGNQVTQDLGQLLSGLIEKGLQASQNGGTGAANAQGGQPSAQQDLQGSAAQTAQALVALLQGGGLNAAA
jgi:hypothetical protein